MSVRSLRRWALLTALVLPSALAAQQTGTVRGVVVDAASGAPIPDAQVRVQGTLLGTATGDNGQFVLPNVPAGTRVINARRLGFSSVSETVVVPAGGEVQADFTLRANAVTLDEVVITGTAAPSPRRALPNNIESIGGEEINDAPGATTVDQALAGRIPGAVISENSGQPGGGVSIRLRGTNSILGGAEPLYVVDGVIVDNSSAALVGLGANATYGGAALTNRIADIDPANIDRIEVLKGAAAAALYGSRANNGVIQIFTKRGQSGELNVVFSTEVSASRTPDRYDLNMAPTAVFTDVAFGLAGAVGDTVERFDIQDEIFRTGVGTRNQLSVSGGVGGTTFYLSGGHEREEGILRSTDYERASFRANLSQQLSSQLELAVRGAFVRSLANYIPEGEQTQGVLTSIIFTPTTFNPAFDPSVGRYPYNPILGANPLLVLEEFQAPERVTRLIGGFEGTWRPIDDLTIRYIAGVDDYRREAKYFQPPFSTGPNFLGEVQNPVSFSRLFNNDLTATYLATPTPALGLTSTIGFRYTRDYGETVRAAASELPPGIDLVAGARLVASQGITEFRTLGWFIEERLSIGDRLYITGGVNWDASSAFGEDERLQLFPRAGVSWVVDEEPFWQELGTEALSSLRLRAAYGHTGGQPPGIYSRFNNYVNVAFAGRPGLVASTIAGNPNLAPERQIEWEIGFDLGAFEDRAQLEFTYYDKEVEDLVLSVPLPPSRGFQAQFQNIGTLTNTGVELALNTVNVDRDRFSWRSRLTYAANRNRVGRLVTDADTLIIGYLNAVAEGAPVGVFFGGIYARDAAGNILYDARGLPIRARDTVVVNGVTSTPFARRVIGDPNPDFTASLSNTVQLGDRLEVSLLLDGRFGNDVANFTRRITELFGVDAVVEREATGDTIPRTFTLNPGGRSLIYEEYIEDGSFVKLREVAVAFQVDPAWAARLGANGLTLRLAGRNLYTWTDYSGLDPEVNLFSANTVARGVDFATTPLPRQFLFSATFNF